MRGILLTVLPIYEIHKEIKKMADFKIIVNKGTHIVDDKEVSTLTTLVVSYAASLRDALKIIWDEIFGKKYSEWIDAESYVPYGFEDPEDLERVLQEEPETFLDMLYPYPGEYFVEEIYQDKNLIYSA